MSFGNLSLWQIPLFTKRQATLSPNLLESRRREIGCYNNRIDIEFDRKLGNGTAAVPFKFQIDWKSLNPNLMAWRLQEILW